MAEYINLPSVPAGTTEAQLQTMYSYLYQMAQAMNTNLDQIGNGILTDEEAALMAQLNANQRKSQTDEVMPEGYDWKGQETLKSLIIKTAEFVKTVTDNYRLVLFGETEASSQFGDYRRKQGLKVDVTPDGIEQTYSFAEIIKGLKTYEVNAKNYIKTGLLRTVQAIPVYGVAIGKDVVTFSEDGTETYNDSNKVAELTADELSFYHNNVKTASYKGNEICFYINDTAKVKIDSTGITFLNGTTKLAELLNDSLKFYSAGTLRSQMDSSGISLVNGTTKLAEFLSTALKFYYNGTLRTEMDNDGVKLKDGSTTLAEFLSTALKFYYNGTLRTQMDNDGITLKDGSTKLAEFAGTGLNFYYNGALRAKMNSDGVSMVKGATTLAEFTAAALKFYYNGTLRSQMDNDGFSIYNGDDLMAKFQANRIGFYNNGTEMMWLSGNKMYANEGFEIDAGPRGITKIGNVDIGYYGMSTETPNGYFHDISLGSNEDEIEIITGFNDIRFIRSQWHILSPTGDLIPQTTNQDRNSNIGSSTYIGGLRPNSIYCNNIHYDYAYQDSAREIKHNIRDMEPVGDKLDRLRPVTFVYNNDKKERDRAGLIYEEAIEVMPEICSGDEKEKAINYVELVPMLLKEIQGLRKRVSELEARNGQE